MGEVCRRYKVSPAFLHVTACVTAVRADCDSRLCGGVNVVTAYVTAVGYD